MSASRWRQRRREDRQGVGLERRACLFCHGACADARRGVPAAAPQFGATRQKIVETRIGRSSCSEPLAAAYEARNVFITSLPEVLLLHMYRCCTLRRMAKQLYEEWQECEIIIGRRPQRGGARQ